MQYSAPKVSPRTKMLCRLCICSFPLDIADFAFFYLLFVWSICFTFFYYFLIIFEVSLLQTIFSSLLWFYSLCSSLLVKWSITNTNMLLELAFHESSFVFCFISSLKANFTIFHVKDVSFSYICVYFIFVHWFFNLFLFIITVCVDDVSACRCASEIMCLPLPCGGKRTTLRY